MAWVSVCWGLDKNTLFYEDMVWYGRIMMAYDGKHDGKHDVFSGSEDWFKKVFFVHRFSPLHLTTGKTMVSLLQMFRRHSNDWAGIVEWTTLSYAV